LVESGRSVRGRLRSTLSRGLDPVPPGSAPPLYQIAPHCMWHVASRHRWHENGQGSGRGTRPPPSLGRSPSRWSQMKRARRIGTANLDHLLAGDTLTSGDGVSSRHDWPSAGLSSRKQRRGPQHQVGIVAIGFDFRAICAFVGISPLGCGSLGLIQHRIVRYRTVSANLVRMASLHWVLSVRKETRPRLPL
jgi:hypothetical protein